MVKVYSCNNFKFGMQPMKPIIVWLRNDLRLKDHPPLFAAGKRPVIPVYILDEENDIPLGSVSKVWLHHSLLAFNESLNDSLIIRKGSSLEQLQILIEETGAEEIYWHRKYEPKAMKWDAHIKASLTIKTKSFASNLFEPWTIYNLQHKPFQVFSSFWKKCLSQPVREILERPQLNLFKKPFSLAVKDLNLLSNMAWEKKIMQLWTPGEKGAENRLRKFNASQYESHRKFPSLEEGTSLFSPHMHFGEISPFQIWHSTEEEVFKRQLVWREFASYLLYHFPYIVEQPFQEKFNKFPWEKKHLEEWQKGLTGYPIVDAGMRQLWKTGWMHNRVRMIVGSFLVKDLLISWQEGAAWFWDTLVDADLANNTLGWQWVGGMGVDAAPYFRIFNPLLQGKKFDPEGSYIRRFIPELRHLSNQHIHCPFEAPQEELIKAGIYLGKNYPYPIVEHNEARLRALRLYKLIAKEI